MPQSPEERALLLDVIEALSGAIAATERRSGSPIRNVRMYAARLARALNATEQEIVGVELAAILRDTGKLAVPEHILSKAGPLTPDELQKTHIHPEVGAGLIAGVPFPYPVAPLILSHHERWDGKGYPAGMKGDEIPLGARILAVVDYFDALISERPSRTVMSTEDAVGCLRQEAGKVLDPSVVERFIQILPELAQERMTGADPDASAAFKQIVDTHQEARALYEFARVMGTGSSAADTMALISSKLAALVPCSACAVFLYNEEMETLHCRFAAGIDAEIIRKISVKIGFGSIGWVARNRVTLMNARPRADLEAAGIWTTTWLQSALVSPLVSKGRFIGTLSVYHIDSDRYTEDHRWLLERACEQAAVVIFDSIVFQQTHEDSLADPLTGLPNTRFMFMHLTRELERAKRLKSELSLLVMDLENLKAINDSYGHLVGDRALCEVASVLRSAMRHCDICVRYSGDKFIVVLAACGADETESKRVELQKAIEDVVFEARLDKRLQLGISIGGAVFPRDGTTFQDIFTVADTRMRGDKNARNRRGSS